MRVLMLRCLVWLAAVLELAWRPVALLAARGASVLRRLSDWAEVEYLLAVLGQKLARRHDSRGER
jgi:hypothetical protein